MSPNEIQQMQKRKAMVSFALILSGSFGMVSFVFSWLWNRTVGRIGAPKLTWSTVWGTILTLFVIGSAIDDINKGHS